MLRFFRLFFGYVTLEILGNNPHRFLNLCSKRGIKVWGIESKSGEKYQLNLLARDFFLLAPIARKSKMKVVLKQKIGLPFSMRRFRFRKAFLSGFLFCFGSLYCLSCFLWDIELYGNRMLTEEMLIAHLKEENIEYGTLIHNINIDEAERSLRDTFPYLVWVSFHIKGTRLIVEVRENTQMMSTKATDTRKLDASDLLATRSGVVDSIITRQGMPQVKKGDEVKKGDKLISGVIPIMNDDETIRDYMLVKADGDVNIRTAFAYKKEIPFCYEKKEYTTREKVNLYCKIFRQSFVSGTLPKYEQYDIKTELKQAKLINEFYLPIYYGKIRYREYEQKEYRYSPNEISELLQKDFEKFCKSLLQKGVQIIGNNVKIKKNADKMCIEGNVFVIVQDGDSFPIEKPLLHLQNKDME